MNRQVKVLSIIAIISGVLVIHIFWVGVNYYNYDILTLLKYFWFLFLLPAVFIILAIKSKNISELPLKEVYAEVLAFEEKWDYHSRNTYYIATFKVHSDLFWTFEVPKDIFNKLVIGQHGILSYREKGSNVYFAFFSSLDNQDNGNQSTSDKQ